VNLKVSRAPPHGRLSQPALKYESRSKFQSWAGPFYANASGSFMGSSEVHCVPGFFCSIITQFYPYLSDNSLVSHDFDDGKWGFYGALVHEPGDGPCHIRQ
jgi:hypothetical protein